MTYEVDSHMSSFKLVLISNEAALCLSGNFQIGRRRKIVEISWMNDKDEEKVMVEIMKDEPTNARED